MSNLPQCFNDKRRKIDVAKALQLRVKNGMTHADIAKYFGVTKQSVHMALRRFKDVLLDSGEIEAFRDNKALLLESVEARLLSDIADPKKRKDASLNNVAYALTAVSNATRLEKGLSTSNVAYVDMSASLEELRAQREQLQEALDSL